jgi:hypothetical protein
MFCLHTTVDTDHTMFIVHNKIKPSYHHNIGECLVYSQNLQPGNSRGKMVLANYSSVRN